MSNEETGKLIDLVNGCMPEGCACACSKCLSEVSEYIVGELQSRYRIEPLENTVEEEKT